MNVISLESKMMIGFRPRNVVFETEDINILKDDIIISGEILAVENHGSERLYFMQTGDTKIYIKDASRVIRKPGEQVRMVLKYKNVYVFDQFENRVYDEAEVKRAYEEFRKNWEISK